MEKVKSICLPQVGGGGHNNYILTNVLYYSYYLEGPAGKIHDSIEGPAEKEPVAGSSGVPSPGKDL